MDDPSRQIGENLKSIRAKGNLSLDELSGLTGVSKSMLRQIELGESSPTISTVWKIARGLRISFTSLVAEVEPRASVRGFQSREALRDLDPGYRVHPLLDWNAELGFETYYVEIAAGAGLRAEGHGPGATEQVYVYAGCLEVEAQAGALRGGPEEVLSFDASLAHAYRNGGSDPVKAIMVIHYSSRRQA